MPVAIGVVLILGAGGAWVALNGKSKTNGDPVDPTRVAQDTAGAGSRQQVGDTTHRRPAAGGGTPTVTTLANRDRPGIDSAALDRELGDILDLVLDPQTLDSGRIRATAIYDKERAPATLRAQAAFMVAQAFLQESRADQACSWNGRALRLAPSKATYLKFKNDQGCGS
jgi:hypothetical protein